MNFNVSDNVVEQAPRSMTVVAGGEFGPSSEFAVERGRVCVIADISSGASTGTATS
jgi:hypothetical protein